MSNKNAKGRPLKYFNYKGECLSLDEIVKETGLAKSTVRYRYYYGKDITEPRHQGGHKKGKK